MGISISRSWSIRKRSSTCAGRSSNGEEARLARRIRTNDGRHRQEGRLFCRVDASEWIPYYNDILRIRDFHALALNPSIIGMYEKLFGETCVAHSRNICRTIFPQNTAFTTPAHQDFVHIKEHATHGRCGFPVEIVLHS